jgi:membrane protease YdiL (CAAX protease family)
MRPNTGPKLREGWRITINLTEFIRRHQLIAYFVLTYTFSWGLWIPVQQLVLDGQDVFKPLISLGIFGPALVSIVLSAILKPRPRQGNRKTAAITFFAVWTIATLIILIDQVVREQLDLSLLLVVISVVTALLPAFIASSVFSTIPGVKAHLASYVRPRGGSGYYLLALFVFPAIWLLGIIVSRALGMEVPFSKYPAVNVRFVGLVPLFFLMNFIHGGLSEEPGWRGFALPRLQARFSPLVASLILGILWAVWHAPARFGGIEAKSLEDTIVEWVLILFITFIFTWLFNRTKGSILVTALLHPSMNTTGHFFQGTLVVLMLVIAFMIFVLILDRMWRRLPVDNPAVSRATRLAV